MAESATITKATKNVEAVLAAVIDPDLGLSIVDLGLVYDVRLGDNSVEVDMTLTSMGCPAGEYLYGEVQRCLGAIDGIEKVTVNLVWDPPWSEERVKPELRFALGLY
jgi:metal-sulfur cluster biosynthetic enzyme